VDLTNLPKYGELPIVEGTQERSAWGTFGNDDEYGCLNFLTPERVTAAANLIRTGKGVSLNLPIDVPGMQFWSSRDGSLEHHVEVKRTGRDDYLSGFYLQGSTQWDALSHVRFRGHGYYGGRQDADIDAGALGIDRWASRGIFGRGVLADVARYQEDARHPIDPQERFAIDKELLEAVLSQERTELEPGTLLLVRTGWLRWYLQRSPQELTQMQEHFVVDRSSFNWPGIDAGIPTVAWLWDHQVAAVAADNPTLEVIRYLPERGWAHHRLLALLGMPLGELWALDELSEHCRATGRYDFFLSSAPLAVPGGVGSPANAYAVF